ncbi:hypothetical protein OQA88_5879 [Cercophora sp. LCS_1]
MEGNVYIYIDNSNLWIQGRKTHAALKLHTDDDPTWRFDAGKLKAILLTKCSIEVETDQKNVHTYLYGSTPPPVDTVWEAFGHRNVKVKTFERNFHSGREKKVDTQLVTDAVNDAADAAIDRVDSEFVIVSGDSDIRTAVLTIADKRRFPVHVWSWNNCLASEYVREPHERVSIHRLDEYIDDISFTSEAWRGNVKTIPKHSVVVLDPDPKAKEIDEFLESGWYPFRRYTVKPEEKQQPNTDSSSQDLVIMHAMASAMSYDAREDFYQKCSTGLKKLGLQVMTFLEYEQTYLSRKPAAHWKIGISNRFSELPGDEFTELPLIPPPSVNQDRRSNTGKTRSSGQKDPDEFIQVQGSAARRKELHRTHEIRGQKRCAWRLYCNKAKNCTWGHTDEEKLYFLGRGPKKARKVNPCRKDYCTRGASCDFAHGEAEFFCPTCEKTGAHHMKKCPELSWDRG